MVSPSFFHLKHNGTWTQSFLESLLAVLFGTCQAHVSHLGAQNLKNLKAGKGLRDHPVSCVCPTDTVNHEFPSSLASACEFICYFKADKWAAWLDPTLVWDTSSTGVSWLIWWEISSFWLNGLQHQTFTWSGLHFLVTGTVIAGTLIFSLPHSAADLLW